MAAVMMVALLPSIAQATLPPARLFVDNRELTGLDSPPVIRNNITMVPARAVFEYVGGVVSGANNYTQIVINFRGDVLVMTIGHEWAQLNGQYIFMSAPPAIINNRTLIPLRFAAEAFGFEVDWDPHLRAAILFTPPYEPGEPYDPGTPYIPEPTPTPTPPDVFQPPADHIADPTPPPTPHGPDMAHDISTAPIHFAPHPTTTIASLLTPREMGVSAYSIVATSPITDVNHFQLYGNRLIVDIYNATHALNGTLYASSPVSRISSSQFSNAPNVTRVVFHIEGPADFSVSLSYDRRIVTVAFTSNTVSAIMPTSNTHSDSFHIQGNFQPSVRMSSGGYPRYLTIYLDNTQMAAHGQSMPVGVFASHFVTGQTNGVAYVRVYIRDRWPAVSLAHGVDSVSVTLHGGLSGVTYDFPARELRLCKSVVTIDTARIQTLDEYLINRFTVTLSPGASGLGYGMLYIGDGYVRTVNLQPNTAGNTEIVFETSRVMTFTVTETATHYVIAARLPREAHTFIVVIDPGHGGQQPGTSHHGLVEKDLVLTISHMVMEHLNNNPNIRAYMTRHDDVTVLNSWRAEFANEKGADLFISIHANAVENRPHVNGIETWYHPSANTVSFTNRQLAAIMQRNMIRVTGAVDRGLMQSDPRPGRGIIVLRDTDMPAVLLEVGFLTNQAEAARLATAAYQRTVARAIYEGILEAFNSNQLRR